MASLAESERQMAEALPSVIWTATADGEIDYANRHFLEYTGTPAEESAGGGWLNALHPDDVTPTLALWRRCVANLNPYQTEFRFLHRASNTYRWHHVAARPLINQNGQVVRWYGITTDIHDTRLAQQAVGDAHRDLHWMLELQSLESRVLESISAAQGLDSILETITLGVQNLAPGARCAIHLASRAVPGPAAAQQAGFASQAPLTPPVRELPITDAQGQPLATVHLGTLPADADKRLDVLTERACQLVRVAIERTRQREQLQENEARFKAVAQASGDVLWDCDLATDAVWYSDGMARLFGRQADTDPALHRGRDASRYIHPDDRERVLALMAHATAHDDNWQLEYRYQKADGSYAHVVNRAVVLRHPDGTAHRILGSITDITRQKLLEEQLYRSQRLEAVGELTGGLAHDFNNLLTIILGNVDQIADEAPAGSEHRQLALGAKAAARKGADLIRSLLAFARQQVLMARPVHVNSLVTGMQALLRNALGDRTTLRFELSNTSWTVLVDPGQLETALLNLAFNARDAMPRGGELVLRTYQARIDGSTHPDPEFQTGAYTVLEVSDTGCGIEPATLRHVFEPFFTTKDTGKGNGLGLSMVYGFVKQSHGHVTIDSRPGEGTTVRLYFPRHEEASSTGTAMTGTPKRQNLPQGVEAVLVVEDDPIVLQFLAGQLRRLGYDVASATTGSEALRRLDERPDTHLLFTDMMLPGGLDGLELARNACRLHPHLAVLISSGYSNEHFANTDRTPEGYWLLAKPYLRADLAMRVRQALGGGRVTHLSIVVPVLNEAAGIEATLNRLQTMRRRGTEVIVVDGGSRDDTTVLCQPLADSVLQGAPGRARQMNAGATQARGSALLFLHADTLLPPDADNRVSAAMATGALWGRFDVQIAGRHWMLPVIAFMMNLRSRCSGIATGDQAMFMRRDVFEKVGGFPEQPLMEDIDMSAALKRLARPACLRGPAITSGRRWETRGVWRTVALMWHLRWRYWRGDSPQQLAQRYR